MRRHIFVASEKKKKDRVREEFPMREKKLDSPFPKEPRVKITKVFWGGKRNWLTIRGAARAEARSILKSQCTCQNDDIGHSYVCRYHQMDPDRWRKLVYRIADQMLKYWRKGN